MGEEVKVEGASFVAETFCILHGATLYGSALLLLVGVRELDLAPNLLSLLLACGSKGQLGLLFFFDFRGSRVQIVNIDGYLAVSSLNSQGSREW